MMATNNAANYKPTQYNTQTGGANGILNNVAPSATSGIPVISQGSSSQPVFGTALVAGGGTGVTSTTAYAVLCGGITSTSALQPVAALGSSGNILTSNGAGALPTFQASTVTSSYTLALASTATSSPADATTYFIANGSVITAFTTTGNAASRMYIPLNGTITKAYGCFTCTTGTNQNSTIIIRKNNTTDTTVSSTIPLNISPSNFNNTGLSIAVSAGDYIEIKWTTPTWATNPLTVSLSIFIYVSV
jgi:hypothetical protein